MDQNTSNAINKFIDKLPGDSIKKAGDVAITTFEKCISPLANWLGGWGELIKVRFEAKAAYEKMLIAETYERAREKVEAANQTPSPPKNLNVHIAVMDYSPLESDPSKRDLLANVLANEEIQGSVHPEIVRILSCITAHEIYVLDLIQVLTRTLSAFSPNKKLHPNEYENLQYYSSKIELERFSLAVLKKYELIKPDRVTRQLKPARTIERLRYYEFTDIGIEFMRCISEPLFKESSKADQVNEEAD